MIDLRATAYTGLVLLVVIIGAWLRRAVPGRGRQPVVAARPDGPRRLRGLLTTLRLRRAARAAPRGPWYLRLQVGLDDRREQPGREGAEAGVHRLGQARLAGRGPPGCRSSPRRSRARRSGSRPPAGGSTRVISSSTVMRRPLIASVWRKREPARERPVADPLVGLERRGPPRHLVGVDSHGRPRSPGAAISTLSSKRGTAQPPAGFGPLRGRSARTSPGGLARAPPPARARAPRSAPRAPRARRRSGRADGPSRRRGPPGAAPRRGPDGPDCRPPSSWADVVDDHGARPDLRPVADRDRAEQLGAPSRSSRCPPPSGGACRWRTRCRRA